MKDILAEREISLVTTGIDIGSATMNIVFSRLLLEKRGLRYVVTQREALHRSPSAFTPYVEGRRIDTAGVDAFLRSQFEIAGLEAEDIDSGALILTGVALLRENAREVADVTASHAGRLVVVSAGDQLESWLCAHGSQTVALSAENRRSYLNVDVGGGTTKITHCRDGEVLASAVLNIGARLVAVDDESRLTRLEPYGELAAQRAGVPVRLGEILAAADRERIAATLVDELVTHLPTFGADPTKSAFWRTGAVAPTTDVHGVVLSGGISEYVHEREDRDFGDLGKFIGLELRRRAKESALGGEQLADGGGIDSTVLGASQYTVQVSGSTIYVSDPGGLPLRNVPVVALPRSVDEGEVDPVALAKEWRAAVATVDLDGDRGPLAVSLAIGGDPTLERMEHIAQGVMAGVDAHEREAVIALSADDVGRSLGRRLQEVAPDVFLVSVDCVEVATMDHVDIGTFIEGADSVPVVVKSLIFAGGQSDE